jgi:hypothetical protein
MLIRLLYVRVHKKCTYVEHISCGFGPLNSRYARLYVHTYISWHVVYFCRAARFSLMQQTKMGKNIQNYHKLYQMATKYSKWQIPTFSISMTSIYPNWDFGYEILPSGNPVFQLKVFSPSSFSTSE